MEINASLQLSVSVGTNSSSKIVDSSIGRALRLEVSVCATILIVRHWKLSGDLTSKFILRLYSNVEKSDCIFKEVLAEEVTTIIGISISGKFAVCVLSLKYIIQCMV